MYPLEYVVVYRWAIVYDSYHFKIKDLFKVKQDMFNDLKKLNIKQLIYYNYIYFIFIFIIKK